VHIIAEAHHATSWHWLAHALGIDNGSGPIYLSWSGWVADLTLLSVPVALLAVFRRHNCAVHRCWRLWHHEITGDDGVTHKVCHKHHPAIEDKEVKQSHIDQAWAEQKARDRPPIRPEPLAP
jgi:hypothetical protein